MNMNDTDLSNLSGFVTADFDGDGLLDIAGFNQEWVQIEILYNLSPYPKLTSLCQDLVMEDDENFYNKTQEIFATGDKVRDIVGIMSWE